jgi:hypothetical protein
MLELAKSKQRCTGITFAFFSCERPMTQPNSVNGLAYAPFPWYEMRPEPFGLCGRDVEAMLSIHLGLLGEGGRRRRRVGVRHNAWTSELLSVARCVAKPSTAQKRFSSLERGGRA